LIVYQQKYQQLIGREKIGLALGRASVAHRECSALSNAKRRKSRHRLCKTKKIGVSNRRWALLPIGHGLEQ
jgi:hypothetical protein